MKAITYTRYGSPEVLEFKEIAKPTPTDSEVLIKIHAASVNPFDWHFMRGTPYLVRLAGGLRKPRLTRLGVDVAGRVEAVGRNVGQFKPGDDVFGACRGAFAEYVCTSESALVAKPKNITFEHAASVNVAALTALQALRNKGRIQTGQKVLINGAAGGVGTFAVQIAKSFGTEVIGVCSTRNVEMVRSIGADQVIDYTQRDFTRSGQRYDLILDCVGNHSLSAVRRVLSPRGSYVLVGGQNLSLALKAPLSSWFVSQKLAVFLTRPNQEDLAIVRDLLASGKVTPVIDRRYSLREVPQAIAYLEEGHARGKVVISV